MRIAAFIRSIVAVAFTATVASGQDDFRTTQDHAGLWVNYSGEHAVSDRAAFLFDFSIRRSEFASVWRTLLVRPGLQWELTPSFRAAGGYTFSYVYPSASSSGRFHTPEHRIFQQVSLSHVVGDVGVSHRYRFENRWFGQNDTTSPDGRIQGWTKRQRFRYQVKGTLPLGRTRAYVTSFNEIFINMGANVRYNVFDQNRFAAGVGIRITPTLRLETSYLNYVVLQGDGRGVDRNHVWMTVLNSTQALRRSTRR
jgi:hypothetical protein